MATSGAPSAVNWIQDYAFDGHGVYLAITTGSRLVCLYMLPIGDLLALA
ncbi:MAG: hypothetical protein R6X34_13925 [Chloroflexota bacterium]